VNHFFLLGNGGGGTSLLRGLLNAHSKMDVKFEMFSGSDNKHLIEREFREWEIDREEVEEKGLIWGNKVPLEKFRNCKWSDEDLLRILDEGYRVIWLSRRFTKYVKPQTKGRYTKDFKPLDLNSVVAQYREIWEWSQSLYWKFREEMPDRVINVSFEDLLLRPDVELMRMCIFLDEHFETEMLRGTMDTGFKKYNQDNININKV